MCQHFFSFSISHCLKDHTENTLRLKLFSKTVKILLLVSISFRNQQRISFVIQVKSPEREYLSSEVVILGDINADNETWLKLIMIDPRVARLNLFLLPWIVKSCQKTKLFSESNIAISVP